NFLILVALLKHFLYGPITRAMTQREQTIADRLEQAEQQEILAYQETTKLQQMQQDFAAHRDQRLAQLRSQLEDQRLTLLATVKDEVASTKARWMRALEQEKAAALRSFRQQAADQLSKTMRQVLLDLADADLEQQIINTFVHRLGQLPPAEQQVLQPALTHAEGDSVIVRSSFPLPVAHQNTLLTALQAVATEHKLTPQFELDNALGCGVELVMPGYKLTWNLATYLDRLEANLALTLEQHIAPEP
ncbi:MAG: ATP F0F1 synthase subunit B, partial [Cyanobacteria bacterium J06638_6]